MYWNKGLSRLPVLCVRELGGVEKCQHEGNPVALVWIKPVLLPGSCSAAQSQKGFRLVRTNGQQSSFWGKKTTSGLALAFVNVMLFHLIFDAPCFLHLTTFQNLKASHISTFNMQD